MPIRNGRISLSWRTVGSLISATLGVIAVSSCPRWLASLDLMLETSGRLLRVLALLQSRRDWPGPELAARLGVSPRTLRRDMDKLRSLGYPVEAVPGAAGGYRLGAGAALPPLLLDDEEAVAAAVGLRTAAGGALTRDAGAPAAGAGGPRPVPGQPGTGAPPPACAPGPARCRRPPSPCRARGRGPPRGPCPLSPPPPAPGWGSVSATPATTAPIAVAPPN